MNKREDRLRTIAFLIACLQPTIYYILGVLFTIFLLKRDVTLKDLIISYIPLSYIQILLLIWFFIFISDNNKNSD